MTQAIARSSGPEIFPTTLPSFFPAAGAGAAPQRCSLLRRTIKLLAGEAVLFAIVLVPCAGADQVALAWADNSTNEVGFKIERATVGGTFTQIATVGANIQTYADTAAAPGTTYNYRVRAYSLAGDSAYSNIATGISGPNTAPTISAIADRTINEDSSTGALAFTVGDLETAPGSLTLTGSSSNQTLVPNAAIVFGGSGVNRTVTVTPAANQNGTATISVTVNDGSLTASASFLVTVNAVNDAPTISDVPDRVIGKDSSTGALVVTVGDLETAAGSLVISGTSSNQTLVPNAAIVIGGSGTSRTVTVNPAAGQTGTATITLTVNDASLTASSNFVLTVSDISANGLVAAYGFDEGMGTIAADASGNGNTGTLGGASWTTTGKFGQALSFNGTNARVNVNNSVSLTLTSAVTLEAWVYPTAAGGWRDVIFKGTDDIYYLMGSSTNSSSPAFGGKYASSATYGTAGLALNTWSHLAGTYDGTTMRLYVNGVQVASRAQTGPITTSTGDLTIGGDPLYGQYFAGRIDEVRIYNRALSAPEIQADMSTAVGSSSNTAPTISNILNQVINEDTTTGALAFSVGDAQTAAGSLTISGSSSNTILVPNANIVLGGSGASRTVTITSAANQSGTAAITVGVSDGTTTTSTTFSVTVSAVNDAPTITSIANQTTLMNTAVGPLALTVADVETAAGSLTLSGSSSNTTLLPNANIVFGGSGASRTVTVTPTGSLTGTATVTLTVSDGAQTAASAFVLNVNSPANTAPSISNIPSLTVNEDTSTGAVSFTVGDAQTAAGTLVVTGASSNTTVVPNANIVFGGSGANRTVTVTPAANQSGSATITVIVSDGSLTASDPFVLTVNAVNDAPTTSAIANQTTTTGTAVGPLSFNIGDAETAAASLTVSGSSSNPTLLPNTGIVFGGSGGSRTVTLTPAANQNGTATVTVTVSDGLLTVSSSFVLTVQPASLPAPWQESDVGLVGAAGSTTWSNGVFTVDGAGNDISGGTDAFHYVFQSATGDCEIVARVTAVENTDYRAKAGILIRESTLAGARYGAVLLTPGDGIRFQRRTTTGGNTSNTRVGKVAAPEWLKINRTGNTFRAYYSSNGATWNLIGSQTITMGSTVTIGLGVCSRNDGTLCTATIDNVAVTP